MPADKKEFPEPGVDVKPASGKVNQEQKRAAEACIKQPQPATGTMPP